MKKSTVLFCLFCLSCVCSAEIKHRFIANCFQQGRAVIIAEDGSIEWEFKDVKNIQDSWVLDNGNYLFSWQNGVKEVTPDKKVVWEYKAPAEVELHSAQPIEKGNVMACECGTKRLVEIDRSGNIVKEVPLTSEAKRHIQFRTARKTGRGTYWVAYLSEGKVRELDGEGKVLRELTADEGHKNAHGVQELPNGNLLVSTAYGGEVKELDMDGNTVWHLTREDMTAAGVEKVGYTAGVERLPNGNTLVSMYHGIPQFFEVTPDKKIVWKYYNEALGNVAGLRLLDR